MKELPIQWPSLNGPCQPPVLNPGEHHVYLCACDEDDAIVSDLAERLNGLGFSCDTHDKIGEFLSEQRREGIANSKVIIFIITPNTSKSPTNWQPFEIINCNMKGSQDSIFFPVLHGVQANSVPMYIKELPYLETTDEKFSEKLIKRLTEPEPLCKLLPVGNIGHGMAWSHYTGYLAIVLPNLPTLHQVQTADIPTAGTSVLLKVVSVIPVSAKMGNIEGENIKRVGNYSVEASRAGKVKRGYNMNFYQITDPDTKKKYLTIVEFPFALSLLPKMIIGGKSALTESQLKHQLELFTDKTEEIVNHHDNIACHETALFAFYEDGPSPPVPLWRVVLNAIKNDPKLIAV